MKENVWYWYDDIKDFNLPREIKKIKNKEYFLFKKEINYLAMRFFYFDRIPDDDENFLFNNGWFLLEDEDQDCGKKISYLKKDFFKN